MKKIFVIAEEKFCYHENECQPETIVCYNLGAWENENDAKLECLALNSKIEDIDQENDDIYFVLELKMN